MAAIRAPRCLEAGTPDIALERIGFASSAGTCLPPLRLERPADADEVLGMPGLTAARPLPRRPAFGHESNLRIE